jgi:hypothetical protein
MSATREKGKGRREKSFFFSLLPFALTPTSVSSAS